MFRPSMPAVVMLAVFATAAASGCAPAGDRAGVARPGRYDELVTLFNEWRAFQRPPMVAGVPDYGLAAMAQQQRALPRWQARLAAIDTTGWPIAQRVDWHLVRAEMNGLDFDQRVLRPWANNPAFYVTVFADESDQPAREGPLAVGAVELWSYDSSITDAQAAAIDSGVRAVPPLLAQARTNLTGNGHDLWSAAPGSLREQSAALERFAARLGDSHSGLRATLAHAKAATDSFATWVSDKASSKVEPSGVGIENYDWYLRNVQLVPYTWREEVVLMERELARAHAFLALEEQRNAGLPVQQPVASAAEHKRRFNDGVSAYLRFLKDRSILNVRPWMDSVMRKRIGSYSARPREFFTEVDYRDPEVMRTHGYHWFDKGRMVYAPHESPIRRGPFLYNIFNSRTEGHATGWEEMMLQAGMFDDRPRTRELIYILLAERAARALGELHMQAREFGLTEAAELASTYTPRGWLSLNGRLVHGEQHLYLQQPGYGTSYMVGKLQMEALLAGRRSRLGQRFVMKDFMEEFDAAGLIPVSLLRWQLLGDMPGDVERMLDGK